MNETVDLKIRSDFDDNSIPSPATIINVPPPVPIMLMARELGPGGSERQLVEIARSLPRSRFEVHVGCFHEGIRSPDLKAAGVPILRLPVKSFLRPGVLTGAWQFGKYLRKHRIRIVHTFDFPLNCFGVPVARAFRVPIVLSSQRAHRQLTPPLYLRVLRWTDRLVHGIVVNSEAVRRNLVNEEHVPSSLIYLCYNGIDLSRFHPENRARIPALHDASLVIGVVCVLRPEKGLPTLIEAFAKVAHKAPEMRLAIVGSGPELPIIEETAKRLGIAEKCLFQPAVPDVAPWLESIDIFVLPSLSEALSNSLMEAMACGCACIASSVGGNPELVRHGETGLLFEPSNTDDLAREITRLVDDPALRGRLAQAAARFIQESFSLTASASRMAEIYEHYLQKI